MKLLALAASTRPESLNKRLLAHAVSIARSAGAEVTSLDYAEFDTPTYHGPAPLPPAAARLAQLLRSHDGLLLATPEYNWSIPGGLKNLIDWLSVEPESPFAHRTVLLMCASPSARGGISGLQHTRVPIELLGGWVYPQMIGIGDAMAQLTETGPARSKDQQHLDSCVRDFVRATTALKTHAA